MQKEPRTGNQFFSFFLADDALQTVLCWGEGKHQETFTPPCTVATELCAHNHVASCACDSCAYILTCSYEHYHRSLQVIFVLSVQNLKCFVASEASLYVHINRDSWVMRWNIEISVNFEHKCACSNYFLATTIELKSHG